MRKFVWVINGKKSKQVPETSLDKYLADGWSVLENEHEKWRR